MQRPHRILDRTKYYRHQPFGETYGFHDLERQALSRS
jgi:hypothetical protein